MSGITHGVASSCRLLPSRGYNNVALEVGSCGASATPPDRDPPTGPKGGITGIGKAIELVGRG
jgi:hypothetical protein